MRSSFQFIKPAIKVIEYVKKISVGSRSVQGRRLVVGYGLQTLPNVLRVVGGEILHSSLSRYLALPVLTTFPLHISLSCICLCHCLCTHLVSPVACV